MRIKHTKGMWRVASYQKPKSKRCVFEGPHGMLGWVGTDRDDGEYKEAFANACIIAHAPEMYDICMTIALYWLQGQQPPEAIRQRLYRLHREFYEIENKESEECLDRKPTDR